MTRTASAIPVNESVQLERRQKEHGKARKRKRKHGKARKTFYLPRLRGNLSYLVAYLENNTETLTTQTLFRAFPCFRFRAFRVPSGRFKLS